MACRLIFFKTQAVSPAPIDSNETYIPIKQAKHLLWPQITRPVLCKLYGDVFKNRGLRLVSYRYLTYNLQPHLLEYLFHLISLEKSKNSGFSNFYLVQACEQPFDLAAR